MMQDHGVRSPAVLISSESQDGHKLGKTRRKARSTRRRLNAMISNASLHFSDTDSEGELSKPRQAGPGDLDAHLLQPVISVTLEPSDDSSCGPERRCSFADNLTDVDEIYTSEPEAEPRPVRDSLGVAEPPDLGQTDLEDVSNDEEEEPPIVVRPRGDILVDFNGETITTKEGDGPFSVEVRNQMSLDESKPGPGAPDILIAPTTDSEDMDASDEEDEPEAACARPDAYDPFEILAASQIVMRNIDKTEQLLSPSKEIEDALSDCPTDVEDIE